MENLETRLNEVARIAVRLEQAANWFAQLLIVDELASPGLDPHPRRPARSSWAGEGRRRSSSQPATHGVLEVLSSLVSLRRSIPDRLSARQH
jgi:hypothetical protein